jgi:chromosome partitioning protein
MVLSQFGRVALEIVHSRVDYAGSMTDGRTVQEIEANGKAAQEMANLWKYVKAQLRTSIDTELRDDVATEVRYAQAANS